VQPGIDCNGEDITGSTALDIAEREGYINLVFHLLEGPVEVRRDPEAEHLYGKQLDLAAQHRHAEIVKLLLERIEDRVAFSDNEHRKGQKLLHWAADNGYSKLMGHLLMWGNVTDLNIKDDLDNTPLHYASKSHC
jgi:ankyrin repeat protein